MLGARSELEAWMAIPFLLLSILGTVVFGALNATLHKHWWV
jgi:hypothetical protein